MNEVFADTFYFLARLNRRDVQHHRALQFSNSLSARLVLTDWILVEVADAFAESHQRLSILDFVTAIRGSHDCEVVPASRELLDKGLNYYHRHADKEWTLTDCISFLVMRERGITDALTGDHHFEQAGFNILFK